MPQAIAEFAACLQRPSSTACGDPTTLSLQIHHPGPEPPSVPLLDLGEGRGLEVLPEPSQGLAVVMVAAAGSTSSTITCPSPSPPGRRI
uniref:Uncharacterized protein n=1 Tax=Oryza nivara TaxID=4536 RepID=A0A0E0ILY4_ORYNI